MISYTSIKAYGPAIKKSNKCLQLYPLFPDVFVCLEKIREIGTIKINKKICIIGLPSKSVSDHYNECRNYDNQNS